MDNGHNKSFQYISYVIMLIMMVGLMTGCNLKKNKVGESPVHSIEDLDGKEIGVQLGTTADIYTKKLDANVQKFNKGADAVQALKQGKLDCVIIDEQPAKAFVKKNTDLSILKENFEEEDYAICVAKDNKELTNKINAAIAELKEEGILEQIIGNFINDETKGKQPYVSPDGITRDNGVLIMATDAEFEPYEYTENGEVVGIDVQMGQAIADKLGMELKIEDMHFNSIITAVSTGKASIGVAGMTVTEDRLKNIDFTDSYTTAKQVIIVRNGSVAKKASLKSRLYQNFIKENRWKTLVKGLGLTLFITVCAVIIGLIIGFIVAILRFSCDKTKKCKLLNLLLKMYLTIIRGTPTMIQLLIIYYVIFASVDINKTLVAIIAFSLNSSAYIAEIVRGGLCSIDEGQFEAGRSIGFNYVQTMRLFILPQAFKNVLPALGNEFIVLLKETAISGYIGIMDLTRAGDFIRSRTYEAFLPLITVAVVYLVIVMILTYFVAKLERRLQNSEK